LPSFIIADVVESVTDRGAKLPLVSVNSPFAFFPYSAFIGDIVICPQDKDATKITARAQIVFMGLLLEVRNKKARLFSPAFD
jgi:hypothetical protein